MYVIFQGRELRSAAGEGGKRESSQVREDASLYFVCAPSLENIAYKEEVTSCGNGHCRSIVPCPVSSRLVLLILCVYWT